MYKLISMGLLFLALIMDVEAGEDGQQGIQVDFGEDSFRFNYISEAWGQEVGTLGVHMSLMTTGSQGDLVSLGILTKREDFDSPIRFLLGGQFYYSNIANSNSVVFALGGEILIRPKVLSGFGFGLSYYIAPQATSFSDAEDFNEYSASINYLLTAKSIISFGYQVISIKLADESNSRDIENGYYIGLAIEF